MNRVRAGLRIPMDLNTKLILRASENGISKNALILQILWEYFEKKVGQEVEMRKLFKKKDLGNDSFDLLGWVMNRFPNLPLYISLIALAISIVMALAKK